MKISPVSNTANILPSKNNKAGKPSFKSIYIDALADVGSLKSGIYPAKFLAKDALLLNEIAQDYPNQDCFIRKGYGSRPRLEYREKPPEVQVFTPTFNDEYKSVIDPNDKKYPCEPLLIYEDDPINFIIGVPSFISTNPSLQYTVKAGYELHKKLMEKKFQIMDVIGRTDTVDFGGETVTQKAHAAIKETEYSVIRFLLESAYAVLIDRASARQIYESNYPKIQTRLDAKRRLDLTTSVAEQCKLEAESNKVDKNKTDICELAVKNYPSKSENIERINELLTYMMENGITLENPEDFDV